MARPGTEYSVLFGFAFFWLHSCRVSWLGIRQVYHPPERAEYVNIGKIVL